VQTGVDGIQSSTPESLRVEQPLKHLKGALVHQVG